VVELPRVVVKVAPTRARRIRRVRQPPCHWRRSPPPQRHVRRDHDTRRRPARALPRKDSLTRRATSAIPMATSQCSAGVEADACFVRFGAAESSASRGCGSLAWLGPGPRAAEWALGGVWR
jgi:hypothetical protein